MKLDNFTHFWFVDSDLIIEEYALYHIKMAILEHEDIPRIIVCPYEFMPRGKTAPEENIYLDMH